MKQRKIYLHGVDSRAVQAIGYDEARRTLYVLYRNERRGLYAYSDVTPSEWRMLRNTSSVGAIVNAHIKPRHSYRQLDARDVEMVIRPGIPVTHD